MELDQEQAFSTIAESEQELSYADGKWEEKACFVQVFLYGEAVVKSLTFKWYQIVKGKC